MFRFSKFFWWDICTIGGYVTQAHYTLILVMSLRYSMDIRWGEERKGRMTIAIPIIPFFVCKLLILPLLNNNTCLHAFLSFDIRLEYKRVEEINSQHNLLVVDLRVGRYDGNSIIPR